MDSISKILGIQHTWISPKTYTELEKLSGIGRQIAARQEKINGLSGLLFGKNSPDFSAPSKDWMKSMLGIATQTNKLHQTLLQTVQQAPLFKMSTQLMGLERVAAAAALPKGLGQYTAAMQAITGNTSKMHSAFQKILNQNPFIQLSREFKGYENLASTFRTAALESLPTLVVEQLNQQTEQAAVLADSFTQPDTSVSDQVEKFRAFVDESFSKITETIRKTARSPKAEINFWAGIISLLITIMVMILQASPATKKQIDILDQKMEKLSEEVREMKKILENKVAETLTKFSETRTVSRPVYLRLNPKVHSVCIHRLNFGDEVNVIVTRHKWAYVTIMREDLPVNGWVLKKYLNR